MPKRSRGQSQRAHDRRVNYLRQHPQYFSSDLESARPALYDALVRKHQSSQERDDEMKQRSTSEMLEVSFQRAEIRRESAKSPSDAESGLIIEEDVDDLELPNEKFQALQLWKRIMAQRFVSGQDDQFDYTGVDSDEALDVDLTAIHDIHDEYFDKEEPQWEVHTSQLKGQTGVQDF